MNVIIHADNGGSVKLRQSNDPKRSGYFHLGGDKRV